MGQVNQDQLSALSHLQNSRHTGGHSRTPAMQPGYAPQEYGIETQVKEVVYEPSQIESFFQELTLYGIDEFRVNAYLSPKDLEENQKLRSHHTSSLFHLKKPKMDPTSISDDQTSTQNHYIKQFGYNIFSNDTSNENNVSLFDPDYIVGPGDQLVIRTWGKVELSLEVVIDNTGHIYIPKVGNILVAGEQLGQLKPLIRQELDNHYVNFDLSVTIGQLRHIKVFILGEVRTPGAYDLSSLNRSFSSLFHAGGPKKTGSMRNISLKRNNEVVATIDLYDFLLQGNQQQDHRLESFDTIYVPPIGDVIKIDGLVKRPSIYELNGKTSLYDAIMKFAGGFSTFSNYRRVQVLRLQEGDYANVIDIVIQSKSELKDKLSRYDVKDGDSITVFPVKDLVRNYVEISGSIGRPGLYAFTKGMTIGNLILQAEGLLPEAYTKTSTLVRTDKNGHQSLYPIDIETKQNLSFKLTEYDHITIHSNTEIYGQPYVKIEGSVLKSGIYPYMNNMRVREAVLLAGLDVHSNRTEIEVYREDDLKSEIFQVNLATVLETPASTENILLAPNDRIYVKQNLETDEIHRIFISGFVENPGYYLFKPGETLSDVLKRSGKFKNDAFFQGAVFRRNSAKLAQIESHSRFLKEEKKRLIYEIESNKNMSEEAYAVYQKSLNFLSKAIEKNGGRIIVDLEAVFSGSERNDLELENDDSLYIPTLPSVIHVYGGVEEPTSIIYEKNKPASYYIKKAGGYSRYSDKRHVYIVKANGEVSKDKSLVSQGDTVYVPEKVFIPINWWEVTTKLATIFYQIAIAISVIN